MGIYIIIGIVLFIAGTITSKVLGIPISKKQVLILLIYSIGGVVSISGEIAIVTSIYVMALSLLTMYGSMRVQVQKAWDNKDVNDKIDNFTEKMVAKNKRLAKENERNQRRKKYESSN